MVGTFIQKLDKDKEIRLILPETEDSSYEFIPKIAHISGNIRFEGEVMASRSFYYSLWPL